MGRALKFAAGAVVLIVVYLGTFNCWLLSFQKHTVRVKGKPMEVIMLHHSDFMYHTRQVWRPAFWTMEHVGGRRYAGYLAAGENSIYGYGK
jgi:hypothetical protein